MKWSFLAAASVAVTICAVATSALSSPVGAQLPASVQAASADTAAPPVMREFRGAWIATVTNIDWPSRPGLSTWEQQAELIGLLNRAVAMHMNAVIFQVRPQADALYDSQYEPWSPFLTGEMGRAPEPYYDPLAFVVREAHARGLELHAWFNPYRALHPGSPGDVAPSHVTRENPDLVRRYSTSLWLDPADSLVSARSIRAILDVVRRYDIDAVHIDDYFYPYRETDRAGRNIDFPDSATWKAYTRTGGTLARNDWRRQNVDQFVQRLGSEVHAAKPWVRFGVSPFGIWRPGYPESVRGLDSYEEIFADARKWLRSGWVDYLAPQIYWPVGRPEQGYSALLAWWVSQNTYGRHIWAGLNAGLARDVAPKGRGAYELVDEIRLTRAQPGASGEVFFSMSSFVQNPDSLSERIARDSYGQPALVPATPWLDARVPARPDIVARIDRQSGDVALDLLPADGESQPWLWVVQARNYAGWTTRILPGSQHVHTLEARGTIPPFDVRVYAVSRTGTISPSARSQPALLGLFKPGVRSAAQSGQ